MSGGDGCEMLDGQTKAVGIFEEPYVVDEVRYRVVLECWCRCLIC